MKYNSTRNRSVSVSAAQAIAQGISADGGLFVPESLPQYSYEDLCKLKEMTYQGRAQRILSDFLTDFTQPEMVQNSPINDTIDRACFQDFNGFSAYYI